MQLCPGTGALRNLIAALHVAQLSFPGSNLQALRHGNAQRVFLEPCHVALDTLATAQWSDSEK